MWKYLYWYWLLTMHIAHIQSNVELNDESSTYGTSFARSIRVSDGEGSELQLCMNFSRDAYKISTPLKVPEVDIASQPLPSGWKPPYIQLRHPFVFRWLLTLHIDVDVWPCDLYSSSSQATPTGNNTTIYRNVKKRIPNQLQNVAKTFPSVAKT